jgi:hypothetical protein
MQTGSRRKSNTFCLISLYIAFWKFAVENVSLRAEIDSDYELERKSNQLPEK